MNGFDDWAKRISQEVLKQLESKCIGFDTDGTFPVHVVDVQTTNGRRVVVERRRLPYFDDGMDALAQPQEYRDLTGQVHRGAAAPSGYLGQNELGLPSAHTGSRQAQVSWVRSEHRPSSCESVWLVYEHVTAHLTKVLLRGIDVTWSNVLAIALSGIQVLWRLEQVKVPLCRCTPSEIRALELRNSHHTYGQIAAQLCVGTGTVENYLTAAAHKIGGGKLRPCLRVALCIGLFDLGCQPGSCSCTNRRRDALLPECPLVGVLTLECDHLS